MPSLWNHLKATECVQGLESSQAIDVAMLTFLSRFVGQDATLTLHGGGNTSVKVAWQTITDHTIPALYIKPSGVDLATIAPEQFLPLDLAPLLSLHTLERLEPQRMAKELAIHLLQPSSLTPSIETLLHAFLPAKYILHTHAEIILTLTNRQDGMAQTIAALGKNIIVLPYITPGFTLAKKASAVFATQPNAVGMVLMHHGLVTWGETAEQAYENTRQLIQQAEQFLNQLPKIISWPPAPISSQTAQQNYTLLAPLIRRALALPNNYPDRPYCPFVLQACHDESILALLSSEYGQSVALSAPITTDHLVRIKPLPLWITPPAANKDEDWTIALTNGVLAYEEAYMDWCDRFQLSDKERYDPRPRLLLIPNIGLVALGSTLAEAQMVLDLGCQTLRVKQTIATTTTLQSLEDHYLFAMEYFPLQQVKRHIPDTATHRGLTALVTGAAGAIGFGITERLLKEGYLVAATDLAGEKLTLLQQTLHRHFGPQAAVFALDVTDRDSVAAGFAHMTQLWGGVDLLVINAGAAHVASLAELDPQQFRRLEQVNIEGTLHLLAVAAHHFSRQQLGGDIVLVSTKNVFAPGAHFGAYSATKAAAHQLARIASLELAPLDVRVNMVAPDAVFGDGPFKSGLWAEVGPSRMAARGLNQEGLEDYYRKRNLLKSRVTANHVAEAVLFFALRRTPTTGATLPVDGGLPDATPR